MNSVPPLTRIIAWVTVCACCAWQSVDGAQLPKRKAGQWLLTTTTDNPKIPPRVVDVCLDEATEALLDRFALGASQKLCSRYDWKDLGGGKASVDATCHLGTMQMTIRGDIVFSGNTAYREEIKTHYDPPLRGKSDAVSVNDGKWTGVCAADMKPGDIVSHPSPTMPIAVRMNLNQAMGGDGR